MSPDLFEWTAEKARDNSIEVVTKNDQAGPRWIDRALQRIPNYPEETATGEDLRIWLEPQIGEPHHANAAGAMIRTAMRRKILTRTGEWRPMVSPKSHARMTPVYRINR
jgi:hypothetical protein